MPPRRAPSVPSVESRAPSPVIEDDEVKEPTGESNRHANQPLDAVL